MKVVVDTNILVSYLFWPHSPTHQAVRGILTGYEVLRSVETYTELCEVVLRPKFDKYLELAEREEFLESFRNKSVQVAITERVRACSDPTDDKFLELAVNGEANFILTGDSELLALDPFRGIRVLSLQHLIGK